jgi:hypothetical protein
MPPPQNRAGVDLRRLDRRRRRRIKQCRERLRVRFGDSRRRLLQRRGW